MTSQAIEKMNELILERQSKLFKVSAASRLLINYMEREFNLDVFEKREIEDELLLAEQAFIALGHAEYINAYLNRMGVAWTEELPDPLIEAHSESSRSMLTFLTTLREKFNFNTADINDITDDLKKYTIVLREYGVASMQLQVATPKELRG